MHIEKIRLKNFKSFGKKAEIPFFKGFTVITGPNGSGKSNIIDSILFCLGLSTSTKQLRAERLTDLVHNGKSEAEVTILFSENGKKYEVARKVKITEKGYYSYYYLNGRSVSLSEIHNFLSQFGIYSDAYNVVMQGDVTRIIEMSPFQRRKIIDDVAGISEFDEKKEKALEELERVRESIEKLEAVIAEVNDRLQTLERDRNEAIRYKEILSRKEEYESYLKAHNYLTAVKGKERVERELERLERQRDELTRKIPEINAKMAELNEKVNELATKISELGDERSAEIQSRILELSSELESIKRAERFYLDEAKRLEEESVKVIAEISKIKEDVESIDAELEEYAIKRIQVGEIVDELAAKMELLKLKLEEVDREHRDLRDRLVSRKEELERHKERRSEILRERDKLVELIRRIDMDVESIKNEISSIELKLKEFEDEKKSNQEELWRYEEELLNAKKRLGSADKELFELRSKISDVEEELKKAELELAKVKATLSTLRTYSKPVELLLDARNRRELPGIFGTVAQLGEVDEEYVTAIEAAAGNALQFIVVETEDDAVTAINYLKAVRGGRASFIPLRRIKNFKLNLDKSILREDGVIDYAVNLVKCEKKFQPVFKFVLRDTVVVDKIETAKRLMDKGFRFVTLEGDLVEKSGLMTGGSSERRGILVSRELVEKERVLSDKIYELQKKKDGLFAELNRAESLRKQYKEEVERLTGMINELRNRKSLLEEKIKTESGRIEELKEKIQQKTREKEEYIRSLKEYNEMLKELEKTVGGLEAEIEEIEKKLRGSEVPKIIEELDRVKDEHQRNKEILISIEKKIESLEFKKEQLESSMQEKQVYLDEIRDRIEEIKNTVEEGKVRAEEINSELEQLRKEEKEIGKELKGLRKERDELLKKMRAAEEEKRRIEAEIDRLVERIKLQNERLAMAESEIAEIGEVEVPENLPPLEEVQMVLRAIDEELSKFGDVNLKAIQEYEEVKARRDEMVEKKMVLEKERADILEKIERYERMKREIFFEVFTAINRNFAEIIRELTNGEGELYLDSDDPFNSGLYIKVKPNNKPVQKLESMSGGEKSLVALALIFAIQMYKPAPFYAFDEVDMFLDGVNVGRVAKMIKKRSKDAQFIVVSLRKPMLEQADAIVGITLGRDNVSQVTGIKLKT
ncbi:MAG: chromosome segregation protein SMC [Archaeoglobus sp.]|uniref:chromosome segregation protein SMC n=1 Tax=Archaeoglobus sp. TaxID=1872626 RepID=UPI001DE11E64|nr:chromosome segregation protein SMC [Archaeoglobus sp.]MBO8180155.1 chromosome segregation protein SMC [Archaeoglobus sp.]